MDAEIPMLEDQRIGTDRSSQPPSPAPDAPTGKQNPKFPAAHPARATPAFSGDGPIATGHLRVSVEIWMMIADGNPRRKNFGIRASPIPAIARLPLHIGDSGCHRRKISSPRQFYEIPPPRIGVGKDAEPASSPPAKPDGRISRIRLSSHWTIFMD